MSEKAPHSPIDAVIQRLSERFPTIPTDRIAALVNERLQAFEGARVKDFIPVLVEHEVHDILRKEAEPAPLSGASASEAVPEAPDEDNRLDPSEVERRREHTGLLLGDLEN